MLTQEQIEDRTKRFRTPLLTEAVTNQFNNLGEGLNLHTDFGQEALLARIKEHRLFVPTDDELLEFLVLERDVPIGLVIPSIKLARDCVLPRRIHLAKLQADRHAGRRMTNQVVMA